MSLKLFDPFENMFIDEKSCFLTGEDLESPDMYVNVFPDWALDLFGYRGKHFNLMDQTPVLYDELKLPCSESVRDALISLEIEIQIAFLNGYDAVKSLGEEKLFLWMAKMVYGMIYHELSLEKVRMESKGKKLDISPFLKSRFRWLHLMLQSLVNPITFGENKPWSMAVVKLKYSKDVFNYHDDTINLYFSLGMNGFGMVCCLQDNGMVGKEHRELLKQIGDTELHPVQFEELCAKFLYSNYLLQIQPAYTLKKADDEYCIEPVQALAKPFFKEWEDDMFAQVVFNYWKPWGLTMKDIVTFPNPPISFLIGETDHGFIDPKSIALPF